MWKWVEKLFKKEEEPEEDIVYACPYCGSTNLGYYTGLINYIQVVHGLEHARYAQSARCLNCGYRTEAYEEDSDKGIEFELRRIK